MQVLIGWLLQHLPVPAQQQNTGTLSLCRGEPRACVFSASQHCTQQTSWCLPSWLKHAERLERNTWFSPESCMALE